MTKKVYYSLYDRLLHVEVLLEAFKKVKHSKGAGGIDHQSIDMFESELKENVLKLVTELREKSYRPLPVKRVEIPKGNGKMRLLGIPAVRDRVIQQALLSILQPIFEEDFHPSSYGYRPGRSCHQAINKATTFIRTYELEYVVDMDLSEFFDTLDHEILINCVRKRVTDGSILKLISMFLKSGVMVEGMCEKTDLGSPQGGVISPLLANIYLNEFDQFMKDRNYRIVRYADDILILGDSKRSAEHAKEVATKFLEKKLKLKINLEKTHVAHSAQGIKFLGVKIFTEFTLIQKQKVKDFKSKIKMMTRRNQGVNLEAVIKRINPVLRGFSNYFCIANCKRLFNELMSWIRRRLRAIQLKLWKTPKRLHRRIRQLGYKGSFYKIKMNSWRNSFSTQAHLSMPNIWLKEKGLVDITLVKSGIIVP
jgi:RNA-directed DNA polymerase